MTFALANVSLTTSAFLPLPLLVSHSLSCVVVMLEICKMFTYAQDQTLSTAPPREASISICSAQRRHQSDIPITIEPTQSTVMPRGPAVTQRVGLGPAGLRHSGSPQPGYNRSDERRRGRRCFVCSRTCRLERKWRYRSERADQHPLRV